MPSQESLWTRELSPLREVSRATPEQVRLTGEGISHAHRLSQQHAQVELGERFVYARVYDSRIDRLWLNWPEDIVDTNPTEVKRARTEDLSEKEQMQEYAMLANLAYARFEKVNHLSGMNLKNLKVQEVNLDIAGIDFTKFTTNNKGKFVISDTTQLSLDERFVMGYLNKQDTPNGWGDTNSIADTDDRNIRDIVDVALLRNKQELSRMAGERGKMQMFADASDILGQNTLTDGWKDYSSNNTPTIEEQQIQQYTDFIESNRPRIQEALIRLKEHKTSEYQKQFKEFQEKWDFKVLAYYPEDWSKDTGWFQCVLLEKDGKKIFSIAGTQLTDVGDLGSDFAILFDRVPQTQTKRMIDFYKTHIRPDERVTIVGHSLGGTLGQIGSSIYGNGSNLKTYTFNAPGAKNLQTSLDPSDPYQKEFQNFTKNKESDSIWEMITNVKWDRGLSFIADRGVDIGNYRIDVHTSSHSISAIIEAMRRAERLERYNINDKKYIESPININP